MQVGCEPEGNRFWVAEEGALRGYSGDKFGTPDTAGGTGDSELVWEASGHVHGVGKEGKGGELVGELAAEEPE